MSGSFARIPVLPGNHPGPLAKNGRAEHYIELRTFFRYIKSVKVLKNVPENAEQLAEIKIDDITKELICGVTLSDIYDFLHFSMNALGNNASSRSRKISSTSARCTNT